MNKYRFREILLKVVGWSIVCISLLTGCKNSNVSPVTPTHLGPNPTPLVTDTVTPIPPVPDFIVVEDISGVYGDFLDFNSNFNGLPSGTYLLTENYTDDQLLVFMMDGSRFEIAINALDIPYPFNDGYANVILTADYDNPSYFRIYSSSWIDTSENSEDVTAGSGKILIQRSNLLTGSKKAWLATLRSDEEIVCQEEHLSPNGQWLAGNCWKNGENYIYILDLSLGTGRFLYSQDYPCQTNSAAYGRDRLGFYKPSGWMGFQWSDNEKILSAYCRNDEQYVDLECRVNTDSGSFSCQQSSYGQDDFATFYRSPDGSMITFWRFPNWNRDESYLLTSRSSCLVNTEDCHEYAHIEIGNDWKSVIWDRTGNQLIWSQFSLTGGGGGPTTVGIANLETGMAVSFGAPAGAFIQGISPDNQWLVLRNDEDLMLLSMNGQTLRRLPRPGDQPASFLGWLVIP